jgi:hypothetical protein
MTILCSRVRVCILLSSLLLLLLLRLLLLLLIILLRCITNPKFLFHTLMFLGRGFSFSFLFWFFDFFFCCDFPAHTHYHINTSRVCAVRIILYFTRHFENLFVRRVRFSPLLVFTCVSTVLLYDQRRKKKKKISISRFSFFSPLVPLLSQKGT